MKDRNGFTLIELIVTIALLGALSVVVGVNVSNMLERQQEKEKNNYELKIEEAACVYIEHSKVDVTTCTTNNCRVSVRDLIKNGLLDKDMSNPNEKGKTVNDDKNSYVRIKWEGNQKKCEYIKG